MGRTFVGRTSVGTRDEGSWVAGSRIDIDRVLDAKPAWARRAGQRAKQQFSAHPTLRRWVLAAGLILWQLNDAILPRHRVQTARNLVIALVVLDSVATFAWVTLGVAAEANPIVAAVMDRLGNGLGLLVRTVWSVLLVIALGWLAQRRATIRPLLAMIAVVFAGVTLLHAEILVWTTLHVLASPLPAMGRGGVLGWWG